MKKLTEFLKDAGFVSASKVNGPNGAFISAKKANGETSTFPVGKKSQAGTLAEYNVLITEDGQAIATVNSYVEEESISL